MAGNGDTSYSMNFNGADLNELDSPVRGDHRIASKRLQAIEDYSMAEGAVCLMTSWSRQIRTSLPSEYHALVSPVVCKEIRYAVNGQSTVQVLNASYYFAPDSSCAAPKCFQACGI